MLVRSSVSFRHEGITTHLFPKDARRALCRLTRAGLEHAVVYTALSQLVARVVALGDDQRHGLTSRTCLRRVKVKLGRVTGNKLMRTSMHL